MDFYKVTRQIECFKISDKKVLELINEGKDDSERYESIDDIPEEELRDSAEYMIDNAEDGSYVCDSDTGYHSDYEDASREMEFGCH